MMKLKRKILRTAAVGVDLLERARAKASTKAPIETSFSSESFADLKGKVTLITGSTKGLGLAAAKTFAKAGAHVIIVGRVQAEAARRAEELPGNALGLGCDITSESAARELVTSIVERFARIDVIINNAGISGQLDTDVWELSGNDMMSALQLNLLGAFNIVSAALPVMIERGIGRIINVSTGAVVQPMKGMAPYSVSKAALEALSKQLARDADGTGVSVMTLRFGAVHTAMTEQAFGKLKAALLPQPEEVSGAFVVAATAPAALVQGRTLESWRLLSEPQFALRSPSPTTQIPALSYPVYIHDGQKIDRDRTSFPIFDRAENTFAPSPDVKKALAKAVEDRPYSVYPDEKHLKLRDALAQHHALEPDNFAIGNGSWELLDRIIDVFVPPGGLVVSSKPGWFGFNMLLKKRSIENTRVAFDRGGTNTQSHNLNAIAAQVSDRTSLIYLISPSNPEGVALSKPLFEDFLSKIPDDTLVVLDEAYMEYADDDDLAVSSDFLRRGDRRIIGLRTFSKFYGLAAMRVGYAIANPEIVELLSRDEKIFNISHLSEVAAVAAISDANHANFLRKTVREERRRLYSAFDGLGLDYIPSNAPYILVELPTDIDTFCARYRQHEIFFGEKAFFGGKYVMFPVSTPEINDRVLKILPTLIR